MTATQKINMAYILFSKQHMYKSALRKWDEQLGDHQDWPNFKEHMCFSYKALKHTGALTIKDTFDRDNVMNMVTTGIPQVLATTHEPPHTANVFSPPSSMDGYTELGPTPALDTVATTTPTSSNSASSSVSDLTLQTLCRGSSSDTTANKINPYYLIG